MQCSTISTHAERFVGAEIFGKDIPYRYSVLGVDRTLRDPVTGCEQVGIFQHYEGDRGYVGRLVLTDIGATAPFYSIGCSCLCWI